MLRSLKQRALAGLAVVAGVVTLTFLLLHAAPGDPAERLLPAFGAAGMDADFLTGWPWVADQLRHLALPLLTLTVIGVGGTARFARGAMLDVLAQPFVAVARAKGVSETRVLSRHVLHNALSPMLNLLGLSLPALFSGAVFVEAVFAWPGVGRIMVEAGPSR